MSEEKKHDRVNMNWPLGLKDRVAELVGSRGVTKFTVEAVETRLAGEDRVRILEKDLDELKWLCQLLADRYAMGGEHDDRRAQLMEVELPAWLRTDGWPEDLAKLVPRRESVPEVIDADVERVPTQPPAPIGIPQEKIDELSRRSDVAPGPYTEADLSAPSYAVAQQVTVSASEPFAHAPGCMLDTDHGGTCVVRHAFVRSAEGSGKVCMAEGCAEGPDAEVHQLEARQVAGEMPTNNIPKPTEGTPVQKPLTPGLSDSFLARVQAKAAEKGLDISGTGLVPASTVATPEKPAMHNHSWIRHDDGQLHCDCGAFIDESEKGAHPNGIVREPGWSPSDSRWDAEADAATEPAPELQVQPEPATAMTPEPPASPTRVLDDFDVDF